MPSVSLTSIISAPQSLWSNEVPTDMQILTDLPAFSISPKTYGSGSTLDDENINNINKINAKFGTGFFHTHYAGQVIDWMSAMSKSSPNGVQTFTNGELNTLVDTYIVGETPNATYIVVDFEPGNPQQQAWMWDYGHNNFQVAMDYIANRINVTHNKYFYDWMSSKTTFTFNGDDYDLDGSNNDGFIDGAFTKNTAAKLINVHANIGGVTNYKTGVINHVGIGYTCITFNRAPNVNGNLPASKWQGVENMVLKCIDSLALKFRISPSVKTIGYYWPLEDKPVGKPGRRSNEYVKFKPNSTVINFPQNLSGKVHITDNRLTYPSNIIEDTVLFNLCFPNLVHNEYWLHGSSYNPYAQIKFSSINQGVTSCDEYGFLNGNYQGSESSLPCPTNVGNYIGTENRTLTAFIKAHYRYAASGVKDVLNGTQETEFLQFQYKRYGESSYTTSVYQNTTGQAALAYQHTQPLLWIWKRPSTGERVLLFWDLFADAFASTQFKVTIESTEYSGITKGNRLFIVLLPALSTSIGTTVTQTVANQIQYRFFTTNHVPNASNLINRLKLVKVAFPFAKIAAPVIFNWRDTLDDSSINGSVAGGVNDFAQPIARFQELLDAGLEPFIIFDYGLNGDSRKMGNKTYTPSDYITRYDNGGTLNTVSWHSNAIVNVRAYTTQGLTALLNVINTSYSSYDKSKLFIECAFTTYLENNYPATEFGAYDNHFDYHPNAKLQFKQWMGNKNYADANTNGVWDGIDKTPTNDNIPQYIGGDAPDRIAWRNFCANTYYDINKKMSETIKAVHPSFKYELDSGYFGDIQTNFVRSDFALTSAMNSFVDSYKHNPARFDPTMGGYYYQTIANKLVSGIRPDQQSCVEWTRHDGTIIEPAFAEEMFTKIQKTIADGVPKLSLSFYEANGVNDIQLTSLFNTSNPTDANTVFGKLHNSGSLYDTHKLYNSPQIITRVLDSNYILNNGFSNNAGLNTELNNAITSQGNSNKVKLQITWGLGEFKFINL